VSGDKNNVADVFVSVLPDLPKPFKPNAKIEKPPVLVVDSKSLTIVMQALFINAGSSSAKNQIAAKKTSQSIAYVVTVRNERRKKDIRRTTSKRNTLTVRNLKPGKYSVRYQAKLVKGKKTVSQTKVSPTRKFIVK